MMPYHVLDQFFSNQITSFPASCVWLNYIVNNLKNQPRFQNSFIPLKSEDAITVNQRHLWLTYWFQFLGIYIKKWNFCVRWWFHFNLDLFLLFYICILPTCMWVQPVFDWCLWRIQEEFKFPRTGVTDVCETPCSSWEFNSVAKLV